jgi:hypothetical protein
MDNSLVSKYFDFGQALEFLKEGLEVTNVDYNLDFRFLMKDGKIYITNFVSCNLNCLDRDGEVAIYEEVEEFSVEDVLNESWYLYEYKM